MDPDAALTDVRVGASTLMKSRTVRSNATVAKFVEDVQNLDDWMSRGGFAPAAWRVSPGRPRREQDGPTRDGVPHGSRTGYNAGCKCLLCTGANRLRRNLTDDEMKEITSNA